MSSDIVTPVKYFWSQSFDGEFEQVTHHKKMMTNAVENNAQMVVIGEQMLHPCEAAWDRNDTDYRGLFYKALANAYSHLLPTLNAFADSRDVTIIMMAAENATRIYKTGGEKAQKFWTDSTNYYNELLSTMLEKKFPNIKFMFNNIRTTARSEDTNHKT